MNEPMIQCPNCRTEIKLTESLAAPLIETTRQQYEQKIFQKEAEVAKREALIREQQIDITKAQESIDEQITVRRISSGVGVERTFLVHSPRVEKIEVTRHGHARRAALYFLRDRVGKAATLREKRRS